jgi:hypothetical protein
MKFRFDAVAMKLERNAHSPKVEITLTCSSAAEAAAFYDELLADGKRGKIVLTLNTGPILGRVLP